MKIYSFLRLLNYKIRQYEKAALNPFKLKKRPLTIIWFEDLTNEIEKIDA